MNIDIVQPDRSSRRPQSWRGARSLGTLGWCLTALAALLAVLLINGAPLFYFDTAGYLRQGDSLFHILDLFQPTGIDPATDPAQLAADDGIVIGSRSVVYAALLSAISLTGSLWLAVAMQTTLLAVTSALICATVIKRNVLSQSPLNVTAICLLAAALGSAPFYVTSLMPDIFAPILLLVMAALVALAPVLRLWSACCLLALGVVSVLVHPSHLAIALIMVPLCAAVAFLFRTGMVWRSILLVALIPAIGGLERLSFNVAVENATESDVVYLPFSTARLISDGPGLTFLKEVCPSPEWATCALFARLHSPDQLSPAMILFSQKAETGSFALLAPPDRKAISNEKLDFLHAVIVAHPGAVIRAALVNTLAQLGLVSIKMTVPNPGMSRSATEIYPAFPVALTKGRLIADDPAWVASLTRAHQVYYLLALAVVLALVLLPGGRVPANMKAFAVLILLGLVANAFVTGAISQPADRYGARVAFLLPMLAVMLWLVRHPRAARVARE